MISLIATVFKYGPILFGFGFIAPLIAQLIQRFFPALDQGYWPLIVGLLIGATWGLLAQARGRWI